MGEAQATWRCKKGTAMHISWESRGLTHRQACRVERLLQLFTEASMTADTSCIIHCLQFCAGVRNLKCL